MPQPNPLAGKRRIVVVLSLLLALGFAVTSLASYFVSKNAIFASIVGRELPLTSDNIYSEIQKDLIRPVFVSSMMASDTFVRDWVIGGERDVDRMTRFLKEVTDRYGAFTSYFISDRTGIYYQAKGILKRINPHDAHDRWYYRVAGMTQPYVIDVDHDQANDNTLTIFINYRVFDYDGRFIGVTGVGLTVNSVRRLIAEYQERYRRNVFFADRNGQILLFGNRAPERRRLQEIEGLKEIADDILKADSGSFQYQYKGRTHLLNTRLVPELNWYLFVEKTDEEDLAPIRRTLYANLGISVAITLIVLFLANLTVGRYQGRLEEMAMRDALTGLLNRQGLEFLFQRAVADYGRVPAPMSVIMLDIDHFKAFNDRHGHLVGDRVLKRVAEALQAHLRTSDIACRWGGEEFLVLARNCVVADAAAVAEKLRAAVGDLAIRIDGLELRVTLSAGVAAFAPTDQPETTVDRADAALYRAKEAGRNRVVVAET